LIVALAGLWLAGCGTSSSLPNPFANTPGADANAAALPDADGEPTGSISPRGHASAEPASKPGLAGDDIGQGKAEFRANNYIVAEQHFRRAVESHPNDADAWLGLAAVEDRLRRFDLADRAYAKAIGISGPTAEILNNQGYSYMLRGDGNRARAKLVAAQHKDPRNKFVQNNLKLLDQSSRKGKAVD
jgi:Flp pilus assembly protein TadD